MVFMNYNVWVHNIYVIGDFGNPFDSDVLYYYDEFNGLWRT